MTSNEGTPLIGESFSQRSLRRQSRSFRRSFVEVAHKHHTPLGSIGSFLFLSNLITGPGMLALPAAYQEGGWVFGVLLTIFFTLLSGLCSGFVVYAWREHMSEDPLAPEVHALPKAVEMKPATGEGGPPAETERVVEFESLVRATGNVPAWSAFQVVFILSMCMMTISCVCVVARELDNLSIITFGNAYGLQVLPHVAFVPSCRQGEDCKSREAFQDTDDIHGFVITQGYLLTLFISVPFSLLEIVDWFQGVMYCVSLFCLVELIVAFAYISVDPYERATYGKVTVPRFGYNIGLVLEVCFWSWAISFAVPMWLSQKAEGVSASRPIWWACLHRGVLDILLGISGAAAFPGLSSLNVLDELRLRPDISVFTEICGVLFAITSLLPNLVDYTMAAARNLSGHVGETRANLIGIGLPYSLSWVFYFGSTFNILVNMTSTLLGGLVQFVVPALLFLWFAGRSNRDAARIAGVRWDMDSWRRATWAVVAVVSVMIVLVYALNAMVRAGWYGPLHSAKHPKDVDTEDYESYAAYDAPSANDTSAAALGNRSHAFAGAGVNATALPLGHSGGATGLATDAVAGARR